MYLVDCLSEILLVMLECCFQLGLVPQANYAEYILVVRLLLPDGVAELGRLRFR